MLGESSSNGNIIMPPKRFTTREPAQIEVYGRHGKIYCQMGNLSTTGAFFEIISSDFMPRKGDLVRVTIQLKQLNRVYSLDAEIIWRKGLGMGLMFLKKEKLFEKLSARPSTSNSDPNEDK